MLEIEKLACVHREMKNEKVSRLTHPKDKEKNTSWWKSIFLYLHILFQPENRKHKGRSYYFFFYNAKLFLNVKSLVQNIVENEQSLKYVIISVETIKWWQMH